MIAILRGFVKSIPTLILSLILAVAVWIAAVNSVDPVVQRAFPRAVAIEFIGQDTGLVIANEVADQVTLSISAPGSVWDQITNDRAPLRAWVDLTGLGAGTHTVPVNVQLNFKPARVVSMTPRNMTITLEELATQEFPIQVVLRGEPAIGFQAESYSLDQENVMIEGPASRMALIKDVRVVVDITQASDTITRNLSVQVLDANGAAVENISITPSEVTVNQPISQRGGYRNVVVLTSFMGQVASGYRLTNMSVYPRSVTVFSSNSTLIDRLPGFVETSPLDLTGVRENIDLRLPLNLPNGVEVVGDQTVLVQVSVSAIEGSTTLSSIPVQITGLSEDLAVRISPDVVDVIISGPVPVLDSLQESDVRVLLDLSGVEEGTYQLAPKVTLGVSELKLQSILPSSIEVVVDLRSRVTPTRTRTPTPTPTPTSTPSPTLPAFTATPSPSP